eukprot:TRINITY_DN39333_c0_g1_i1.p1 TRINITY_DN39333_c0_g1~~TRINITY_DN39333_c0_g1_i1.p1  ORF type:complete len:670 (+),score=192.67 TRINITY_DN39333_c0_g1_i1:51-2012(+)
MPRSRRGSAAAAVAVEDDDVDSERRYDPTEQGGKRTYTREQFLAFYGGAHGRRMWRRAGRGAVRPSSPGAKGRTSTRLQAVERSLARLHEKVDRMSGGSNRFKLFADLAAEVGFEPMNVAKTLGCIVDKAKELIGCQRGSVFLLDKANDELFSVVFSDDAAEEIRIPTSSGIAGHVVTSGEKVRVKDAYECPYFSKQVDEMTGFRTKSVLCLPITHQEPAGGPSETIAVIQLVNKVGRTAEFTDEDEADLAAFALMSRVFLWNASLFMFKEWSGNEASALIRNLSNISAHLRPTAQSPQGLGPRRPSMISAFSPKLAEWSASSVSRYYASEQGIRPEEIEKLRSITGFDVTQYPVGSPENDRLIPLAVVMWKDLGLCERFDLSEEKLTRLTLAVRDRYRPIPYHNFTHAFDVAHAMYGFLTKGKMKERLSDLEVLSVFVAALFHDCDHHGLNNNFHLKADTPLSLLMRSTSGSDGVASVLEVHHCNIAIEVMSSSCVDVFAAVSDEQRSQAWQDVIACILATDMVYHKTYCETAGDKLCTDQGQAENRQLVMQMLLKAADISNITKEFDMSKKWGVAVQNEFYLQGDRERDLGVEVNPMFDREKQTDMRTSQLGFMRGLGIPFYSLFASIFPSCTYVLDGIQANVRTWEGMGK